MSEKNEFSVFLVIYLCVFACVFVVSSSNRMFCHTHGTETADRIHSYANADDSLGFGHRENSRRTHCMTPIYCDGTACDAWVELYCKTFCHTSNRNGSSLWNAPMRVSSACVRLCNVCHKCGSSYWSALFHGALWCDFEFHYHVQTILHIKCI